MDLDREPDLLAVARRHVEAAMALFGHPEPNVAFREGLIEDLAAAELEDEGFDVVDLQPGAQPGARQAGGCCRRCTGSSRPAASSTSPTSTRTDALPEGVA